MLARVRKGDGGGSCGLAHAALEVAPSNRQSIALRGLNGAKLLVPELAPLHQGAGTMGAHTDANPPACKHAVADEPGCIAAALVRVGRAGDVDGDVLRTKGELGILDRVAYKVGDPDGTKEVFDDRRSIDIDEPPGAMVAQYDDRIGGVHRIEGDVCNYFGYIVLVGVIANPQGAVAIYEWLGYAVGSVDDDRVSMPVTGRRLCVPNLPLRKEDDGRCDGTTAGANTRTSVSCVNGFLYRCGVVGHLRRNYCQHPQVQE